MTLIVIIGLLDSHYCITFLFGYWIFFLLLDLYYWIYNHTQFTQLDYRTNVGLLDLHHWIIFFYWIFWTTDYCLLDSQLH